MDSTSPRVLVIGGLNGFVGSNVTEALVNLGRQCVVTQHSNKEVPAYLAKSIGSSVIVEEADATSLPDLRQIGEKHLVESIVDVKSLIVK
jgi:nucleoside-diphosphate-sugar epimerase